LRRIQSKRADLESFYHSHLEYIGSSYKLHCHSPCAGLPGLYSFAQIAHVGGDLCSLSALVSNTKLFVLYCDLRRLHECYLLLILVSCTNSKGKAWTVLMSKVCDKTDKDTVTVFELYIEFKGTLPA